MTEQIIREFSGKIIGFIETDSDGNKVGRTFPSRKIVGRYDAKNDCTRDFSCRIVAKGDCVVSLITSNKEF